jgi:hypothetical protein
MAAKHSKPASIRPQSERPTRQQGLSDLECLKLLEHDRARTEAGIREYRQKLGLARPNADLVDRALYGPPIGDIAGVQVLLRGMADQIDVLTGAGNEPLQGFIATGFSYILRQADEQLAHATEWVNRLREKR